MAVLGPMGGKPKKKKPTVAFAPKKGAQVYKAVANVANEQQFIGVAAAHQAALSLAAKLTPRTPLGQEALAGRKPKPQPRAAPRPALGSFLGRPVQKTKPRPRPGGDGGGGGGFGAGLPQLPEDFIPYVEADTTTTGLLGTQGKAYALGKTSRAGSRSGQTSRKGLTLAEEEKQGKGKGRRKGRKQGKQKGRPNKGGRRGK